MDFTQINTKEEFDARVTEIYGDVKDLQGKITTLTGERDALQGQVDTLTGERDALQGKVKGFETGALRQRIAREKGIPAEMADRLTGETEADIRKDAETVAKLVRAIKGPAPLFDHEKTETDAKSDGLKSMLSELRGE